MPRGDLPDLERRLDSFNRRLRRVERVVDEMTKADEISRGVAAELDRRARGPAPIQTRPQFTWPQKVGGALAAIILTLDTLAGWLK